MCTSKETISQTQKIIPIKKLPQTIVARLHSWEKLFDELFFA